MNSATQYLWLGYQIYAIAVMHVVRLGGYGGCGRTEERVARLLQHGKKVCLESGNAKIWAQLEIEEVTSVAVGRQRVNEIAENHGKLSGKA